jgi:hypothetical protein
VRFGIYLIASILATLETIRNIRSMGGGTVLPERSSGIWRSGALLLVFIPILSLASPGLARADLRKDLGRLARDIKSILRKRGENAVAVGQFTGPPNFPSSGGPGIARTLAEDLRKIGVKVKVRAPVSVEGKYEAGKAEETGKVLVQLTVRLLDRQGKQLLPEKRRTIVIFADEEIASVLGLTVHLDPLQTRMNRDRALERGLEEPGFNVMGKQVAAANQAPYAVEILVASSPKGPFTPRTPTNKDGLAYVPIQKKEYYRIRVINRSAYEAAVNVTIDGINMFAFSKVKDKKGRHYTRFMLAPDTTTVIKGWHITNKQSRAFEVTRYAKSAAAELRSEAGVGTITAAFAAAWPRNGKPPPDEKLAQHKGAGAATGRGPRIGARFKEVERKAGRIRDAISVRYTK